MSKKTWLIVGAIVLGLIVVSSLGAMIGLAAGALLSYFGWRQAALSEHVMMKVLWWVILLIGVCLAIGSLPGIIGLGALYLLVKLYERWKENKDYTYDM